MKPSKKRIWDKLRYVCVKLRKNILLLLLILYILLVYYVFMFWNLFPIQVYLQEQTDTKLESSEISIYTFSFLVTFLYLLIWTVVSLIKVSLSDPGEYSFLNKEIYSFIIRGKTVSIAKIDSLIKEFVKLHSLPPKYHSVERSEPHCREMDYEELYVNQEETPEEKLTLIEKSITVVSATNNEEILNWTPVTEEVNHKTRRCRFCILIKAKKTHHCRICKKCIRIYDHHCFYINNCIGVSNYKYFINFIFYLFMLLLFTSIAMSFGLNFLYIEYGMNSFEFLFFSTIIITNIVVTLFIGYMVFYNMWLLKNDITNAEYSLSYKDKKNTLIQSTNFSDQLHRRLGKCLLLWFFPFDKDHSSEGYE